MRRATLILLVSAVAAACGERPEPLGRDISPYPVTVRGAGDRSAVVNRRPERIVALDPGSADLVVALDAGDRLVGAPGELAASGDTVDVVRPNGRIDVEAVVALDPDLIVATPVLDPLDVGQAQRETRATLYVQPDRSLRDVERAALELGLLVGEPVAARDIVGTIRRDAADVAVRVGERPPIRVFIDTGFFITVPDRSLLGDLVRRANGVNVANAAGALAPCEVVSLSPNVVLTTDRERAVHARLADAGCAAGGLRVVHLPEALIMRAGPQVGRALERVAQALHPDAFR